MRGGRLGEQAQAGQPAMEQDLGTARGQGALRLCKRCSGCWITGRNHGKFPDGKMDKARKYSFKGNRKSFAVWEQTSLKVTAQF